MRVGVPVALPEGLRLGLRVLERLPLEERLGVRVPEEDGVCVRERVVHPVALAQGVAVGEAVVLSVRLEVGVDVPEAQIVPVTVPERDTVGVVLLQGEALGEVEREAVAQAEWVMELLAVGLGLTLELGVPVAPPEAV